MLLVTLKNILRVSCKRVSRYGRRRAGFWNFTCCLLNFIVSYCLLCILNLILLYEKASMFCVVFQLSPTTDRLLERTYILTYKPNSYGRLSPLGLFLNILSGTFWLVLHSSQCEKWQNLKNCNFALYVVNYLKTTESSRKIIQYLR